jgi:flagella basal body P-ring formation protein FlgA
VADLPPPPPPAESAIHAQAESARVAEAIAAFAVERCSALSVDVRWTGLAVEPPEGARLVFDGDPCHPSPRLRLSVLSNGVLAASYHIRPSLELVVRAPVAPDDVRAGERFAPIDGEARIEQIVGLRPLGGEVIATRALRAGDPVTDRVARLAPDVLNGASVEVEIARGSVRVRAQGTVLGDAFVGQSVQVRNEMTGAVQHGVLLSPTVVRLP